MMIQIIFTLLLIGPALANANSTPILDLLYNTDDLAFLSASAADKDHQTMPVLTDAQARSLAVDLNDSLSGDGGSDPIYLAKRLANVGMLQTYAGDLPEGDQSLRAALARLNQSQGLFDPQLTRLLSAIGINAFLREDYDTAEDHFRWSQNIQHRSHGLFATQQTANLNWLTRIYLNTNESQAADIAQRYVLRIAKQAFPAGSAELSEIKIGIASYLGQRAKTISPFAEDLDRLLRQTLYTDALELLDQAILDITATKGRYAVELIDALETKARIHSWRGRDSGPQEEALEQILAIVEQHPETTPAELTDAWLALADGYILTGNKKALPAYRAAWQVVNPAPAAKAVETPAAERQASADLEPASQLDPASTATEPVLLWPAAYQAIYFNRVIPDDDASQDAEYGVELRFTVSKQGRPKRITVLNRNVPSREVRWTRSMVLGSRYRPALRDGIAEEVEMTARQPFIPRPVAVAPAEPAAEPDPSQKAPVSENAAAEAEKTPPSP